MNRKIDSSECFMDCPYCGSINHVSLKNEDEDGWGSHTCIKCGDHFRVPIFKIKGLIKYTE